MLIRSLAGGVRRVGRTPPGGGGEAAAGDCGARLRKALRDKAPLPELEEIRKAAQARSAGAAQADGGEWLTEWIGAKGRISKNTVRGYQIHIEKYLIPHLGRIPLDRLRVAHVHAMIAAIADDAEAIPVENAARRDIETAMEAARKAGDRQGSEAVARKAGWHAAVPQAGTTLPPGSGIRATLRTALTAACAQQLITVNVAALAELESGQAAEGSGVDAGAGRAVAPGRGGPVAGDGVDGGADRSVPAAGHRSRVLRTVPSDRLHRVAAR